MKPAKPFPEGMDTHGFGLGALLLALLVPASVWMVAQAGRAASEPQEPRRVEFVHSAAGIRTQLHVLRETEKALLAAPADRNLHYRARHEQARRRIDELSRSAASVAEAGGERARLEELARLVRQADARYDQLLARGAVRPVALQTSEVTFDQP